MNVLLLRHYKNGQIERSITHFDTLELALLNFYGTMRASVGDANCSKVTCELVDEDGNTTKCDRYIRTIPEESEENE